MPPASKYDSIAVVFDLGTEPEFHEAATGALGELCARHSCILAKHPLKLILMNTKKTNNRLGYPNICVVTDFEKRDLKFVADAAEYEKGGTASWLDAVLVALSVLESTSASINLQVILFTDLQAPLAIASSEDLEAKTKLIITKMRTLDAYLYILGPKTVIPNVLRTHKDIKLWMDSVVFAGPGGDSENHRVALRIVQKTKGVICDLDVGLPLTFFYKDLWGMQPWKQPLEIGDLHLKCSLKRFLKQGANVKSKAANYLFKKQHWVDKEDSEEIFQHGDVVSGVKLYDKMVPIFRDTFSNTEPKMFKLVGFTASENVPEIYMCGEGSHYLLPEVGYETALEALVETLASHSMFAVVRRKYANGKYRPKMSLLIPKLTMARECLLLVDLPYADDVGAEYKEEKKTANEVFGSCAAQTKVCDFLKDIDVSEKQHKDEHGSLKLPLDTGLLFSPYTRLSCRRFGKKKEDSEEIKDILLNLDIINEESCEKLKALWPVSKEAV